MVIDDQLDFDTAKILIKNTESKRRINEIFYNFIHRNNNGINHYLCTFLESYLNKKEEQLPYH